MIYSVNKGFKPGLYDNWKDCEKSVKGYPNARFKKFKDKKDAEYFLINGKDPPKHKEDTNEIKHNKNIEKYQIPSGINVFTDGSRILKDNNFYGGYGIYFGDNDERNKGEPYTDGEITNNRAELFAILESLNILKKEIEEKKNINIFTDSEYSLKSVTEWYKKWEKENWKDKDGNVRKNIDYIIPISSILKNNKNINIKHIYSHTGKKDYISIGNGKADNLAVNGAKKNFK
tara:strand:+ start:244 stop:936 length:693 start_codon:yes stop_codon:yes gene_type:complete